MSVLVTEAERLQRDFCEVYAEVSGGKSWRHHFSDKVKKASVTRKKVEKVLAYVIEARKDTLFARDLIGKTAELSLWQRNSIKVCVEVMKQEK